MRPTKRSRESHLAVDAPWTKKHHRQRGHGPNRRAVPKPAVYKNAVSKYGVPTMKCGVPGCPHDILAVAGSASVNSLDRTTNLVTFQPASVLADERSKNAVFCRIGHLDLIRNPRYPRPKPNGEPSRPMILVPMTRKVMCCVHHAAEYNAACIEDPNAFLPDGKLGKHERIAQSK